MENVILRGGANCAMLWVFPAALIATKGKKSFGSVFACPTDPLLSEEILVSLNTAPFLSTEGIYISLHRLVVSEGVDHFRRSKSSFTETKAKGQAAGRP